MRHARIPLGLAALTLTLAPIAFPAQAQKPWEWATQQALDGRDQAVLHPLVQKLLKEDAVGARRPWHSPSGRSGFVYLLRGGDQAQSDRAVVRITDMANGHERRLFVFHYRKDSAKGWDVAG